MITVRDVCGEIMVITIFLDAALWLLLSVLLIRVPHELIFKV
jgi:hypothetical protein